ncbi:MAG: 5-formyltetrahydrofolate cyclo-ligase [Planctomycetota bacterium]|nr:5-formyltetrahydrofolate cyclo-ligase [Planctomycetota bacterium]
MREVILGARSVEVLAMDDLREAKVALRERVRATVREVTPERWAEASSAVCARILELTEYRLARVVMLYHPTQRELSLRGVAEACLRTGRTVCLPRANWITGQLQPARLCAWGEGLSEPVRGIREPLPAAAAVAPSRIDLVVVPGVAFDACGGRLGRGSGFYDRFLAGAGGCMRGYKVGVCLDEQVVESVPMGAADTRLDAVVTPTRVLVRQG